MMVIINIFEVAIVKHSMIDINQVELDNHQVRTNHLNKKLPNVKSRMMMFSSDLIRRIQLNMNKMRMITMDKHLFDNKVEIGPIAQSMKQLTNHHHHQVQIIHFQMRIFK